MRRLLAVLVALCAVSVAAPAAVTPPVLLSTAPRCAIFPATNPWNERVDHLPVASGSATLIVNAAIPHLHPDFGTQYGIPYNVVAGTTERVAVSFDYADESYRGRYPIPAHPAQEHGSDAHILIVDRDHCQLYELWLASHTAAGWHAGSGAFWNLESNAVRPAGFTSADAAGLPILPGLARADEARRGVIRHALRFTLTTTQRGYLFPARHDASSVTDPAVAPMGLRLRLRSSFPISRYPAQARIVLEALKQYGMIVADNGSSGYVTGAPSSWWNDDQLHTLQLVPGSALEVVDTTSLTGTPPPSVLDLARSRAGGGLVLRFFLTADATLRVRVRAANRIVYHRTLTARQGFVRLVVPAPAGPVSATVTASHR
jgi:hypothetical protein